MTVRTAKVTLTGVTPLLMRRNDDDWEKVLKQWRSDPSNKEKNVKGDDRSPAFTWIGGIYHDGKVIGMPADNLMTMLREGGAKVPTGKGQGTYKRQTQSCLIVMEPMWPMVTVSGKTIPWSAIEALNTEEDFDKHIAMARKNDFELFKKAVIVRGSRNIRIRPMFAKGWQITGTIAVTDDVITNEVFENVLIYGGRYAGLGDWRPSAPKAPGPYGQFVPEIEWLK